MRYDTRYRYTGFTSSYFPKAVKWLLIVNITLFVCYFLAIRTQYGQFFQIFSLSPFAVVRRGALWQLVTYMFLHDPFGFTHILFNMLTLWMFGADLERQWGTRKFLKFYMFCGVGAGICDVLVNTLLGNVYTHTIGSSGAIYGLLLAFGVLYPDRTVLFSFLFPIKAKYFVMILGGIAFLSSLQINSGVSNVAHLGGMLFGYIFLKSPSLDFDLGELRLRYQRWKLQRAKKKFQVYMRKHGSDRNPRVH